MFMFRLLNTPRWLFQDNCKCSTKYGFPKAFDNIGCVCAVNSRGHRKSFLVDCFSPPPSYFNTHSTRPFTGMTWFKLFVLDTTRMRDSFEYYALVCLNNSEVALGWQTDWYNASNKEYTREIALCVSFNDLLSMRVWCLPAVWCRRHYFPIFLRVVQSSVRSSLLSQLYELQAFFTHAPALW